MKLVCLLGSVTPPGRLSRALSEALARADGGEVATTLVDLGPLRLGFADGRPLDQLEDDTPRLMETIRSADAVLIATPVYRATMTGALKNALDLLPAEALMGKPCGLVAMGATLHHALGAASHLRDVLAWFGALVAPVDVYLASEDFSAGAPTAEAARQLDELVETLAVLAGATRGQQLGPLPLAARRPG